MEARESPTGSGEGRRGGGCAASSWQLASGPINRPGAYIGPKDMGPGQGAPLRARGPADLGLNIAVLTPSLARARLGGWTAGFSP